MKKLVVVILAVVLFATMAFGCTNETTPEATKEKVVATEEKVEATDKPEVVEPAEPVTIKVTSGLWSKPEEQQYVREEALTAFEEETGITVELEVVENIQDMMKAQKASGEWTSDVVITHSGDMTKYISNEYVQSLNSVLANMDITILPAFNESTSAAGETYYIPISADVYLVIANNKALEYLPTGVDINAITWEQYKDWAIAIAVGEGTPKTAMPALAIKSMVYQMGGIGLSYGAGFAEINSEAMVSAWNLVGEMLAADAIVETSFTYGDPVDLMKSEEAWLSFHHMGPVGQVYASAPAQFTIAPAPAGPVGNGSIAGAWGMGITAGTEKLEAAQAFIEYMSRPDVLYKVTQGIGGTIPPVQEVVDVLGSEPADVVVKMGLITLQTGIPHGVPGSDYTDWGAVKTVYDETFKKLWDDKGVLDTDYLVAQQAALEALLVE